MTKIGLIIAGFDPSAGAGILMDIKVFAKIGVYAFAIPTSLVEENTDVVKQIDTVKPSVFKGMLDILLKHSYIKGVKLGMLYNSSIAKLAMETLSYYRLKNVVLDPVLYSSSGAPLLKGNRKKIIHDLLPLCTIVTPNVSEASSLSGIQIKDKKHMLLSAQYFIENGAPAVIIKGGHFIQKGLDLYMDRKQYVFLEAKALLKDVHGTGCIMSSAIAAFLIKGYNSFEAVKKAKLFTYKMIKHGIRISPSLTRYVASPDLIT
jgi:hydroxymethylpyrimidine/phosphomethylpyrimidine kinase